MNNRELQDKLTRLQRSICCNKPIIVTELPEGTIGGGFVIFEDELYYWNGGSWTQTTSEQALLDGLIEERVCLNTAVPTFTPLDVNNPTTTEVQAYVTTNLTSLQLDNGTQVTWFVTGNGGSCDNPDFVWTLSDGQAIFSNKRIFNTRTVYVDSNSGSDVTGRRGYQEFPFKTLNAAITVITEDDTLHIFPGDYIINNSTPTKTFGYNIHSDLGSNIDITTITTKYLINTTSLTKVYNLKFDRLFNSILSTTAGLNFALKFNLEINTLANLTIRAQTAILNNCYVKNLFDSYIVTLSNTILQPINKNFTFDNVILTPAHINNTGLISNNVSSDYTIWNTKVNSINCSIKETFSTAGNNVQLVGLDVGSDIGTNKLYNIDINSMHYVNANIYTTTPNLYDSIDIWNSKQYAVTPSIANTASLFYIRSTVRDRTDINININDINATGNLIVANHATGFLANSNFSVKGVFKKGIAFISTLGGGSLLTTNLHLNVLSEDCHAVDLATFPSSATIYITGRIKVTKAGFPCISIRSGVASQRVILKNLTLINDGTVGTILTNSVTPIEVLIQNVTSNSLIIDPNVTEIGQTIVRNVNYN